MAGRVFPVERILEFYILFVLLGSCIFLKKKANGPMSWRRALLTASDTDLTTKRYSPLRLEPESVENCLPEEALQEH